MSRGIPVTRARLDPESAVWLSVRAQRGAGPVRVQLHLRHLGDVVDGLLEQLAIGKFAIYVMDFGAAVGFRLALRHPERLSAIIVQNAPLHLWEQRGWWA